VPQDNGSTEQKEKAMIEFDPGNLLPVALQVCKHVLQFRDPEFLNRIGLLVLDFQLIPDGIELFQELSCGLGEPPAGVRRLR
jgi:hypothetical protein